MNESQKNNSIILGVSFILALAVFGMFYYSAQKANTKDILSVTGSTKTKVTSDQAKLIVSISKIVNADNLSYGYDSIAKDLNLVHNLLKTEGVAPADMVDSTVYMNQIYDYKDTGITRYDLRQTVTIQSNDVNKLTEISKKVPSLASQGVIVSIQSLEYYYSKLPDLRVSLLSDAVKDAKARAQKIAEGTGRKVGNVQAASSGVIQVLPVNSVDVSDYGSYDTSSIEKEIMVTVKASFRLK